MLCESEEFVPQETVSEFSLEYGAQMLYSVAEGPSSVLPTKAFFQAISIDQEKQAVMVYV